VPYADVVRQGKGRRSRQLLHINLVHNWLQALDDRNVPALVETFRPHGLLRIPGAPELAGAGTFRGRQELREHYEVLLATFDVKRLARGKCTLNASDDYVHLCGRVMLRYRGRGPACRLEVALAFHFKKGRVAELTVYCDTLAIYRLVGSRPDAP
jgi:ketosteroid isomerase-like protein